MKSILMGTAGRSQDGALLFGDKNKGYYGEIKEADFIAMQALCTAVNFSVGTLLTDNAWLKFAYQEKILYIPKKPVRRNLSANNIISAGLSLSGDKTITIGGHQYKLRLMYGVAGAEWDSLIYPLVSSHPNSAPVWGNLSEADLGITGLGTFCEEVSGGNRLYRGYSAVTALSYISQTNADNGRGWRPVLERVI